MVPFERELDPLKNPRPEGAVPGYCSVRSQRCGAVWPDFSCSTWLGPASAPTELGYRKEGLRGTVYRIAA